MDSPINRMIDSVQSRTPAVSKNIEKNKKSLNQKVVELVASANRTALPDRQIVPRNALIVMARAMKELSSLPDESREAGVIREVNKFISLNQNTFRANDSYAKHTDLLPAGHPLSDQNSSLSIEDYLQRYASWLSADPGISDDVRHLVAAAYSQLPGSLEREHAFVRLNAVKASALPAYFKIDISALVAAFSFGDGNSSAARRARVKLQWRDRFGKWIEMGRGVNFKARLSNGNVVTVAGTYIGSDSNAGYSGNWARKEANAGLVEVKGDVNIPDGIYSVSNSNAESFKARLSESELERAGVDTSKKSKYKLSSQFDESIPNIEDLLDTKVDAPSGWTKNDDGSFTSDDDYKAVQKDDGYEIYRLDPEGKTGDKVGDAKTWADVQNVAAADEEAYDKYKEDVESGQLPLGDGERPEPRYSRMNRQVQEEIKQLRDQIPQNEESNKRIENQLERALAGKDSQGRDLPEGWYSKIDPSEISETYYKDIPGATRNDEYLVAIVSNDGKINYGSGGFWFDNARPASTWDQVTEDTPKIIDQINQGRARIGLDPIGSSTSSPTDQISDKEIFDRRMAGESLQEVADSLGIPREEVRAREAKYARENPQVEPDIINPMTTTPTPPSGVRIIRNKDGDIDEVIYMNSVKKSPNDPYSDVFMDFTWATDNQEPDQSWEEVGATSPIDYIVKIANKFGIHVEESPNQSPVYRGDEIVYRFTRTGDPLTPEQVEEFMGSEEFPEGIFASVFDDSRTKEEAEGLSWESLYEAMTGKKLSGEPVDGDGPDEPPTLWGSTNSIKKPDGKTYDILLAEMDETDDSGKTMMQSIVDEANKLGIHVELSPEQTGLGFGDERVARFTFPEKTVSPELAKKLIGSDPDSGDGILLSRIDNQEDWDEAFKDITGDGPDEPPFNYKSAKAIVFDKNKSVQERYAAVFDGARGENIVEYVERQGIDVSMLDSSIPKDAEVVFADDDGLYVTLRYPDGVYYYSELDSDSKNSVKAKRLDSNDEEVATSTEYIQELFNTDGLPYYRGGFIDKDRQSEMEDGNDSDGDAPDEPPTPPSGGTPPKSPAPSSPAAPALFREFDVPAGAFNLRTVEYEPEGRVDEASTDFTDAPNRLAVRFPLDTLVRAFTRSLIGDVDENVIEDIVDINDDGDGNLPDLSEVGDVLENNLPINVPRGERPRASGAGTLEFNAGDEFVPAEALYNAVWLAGGDPNRVIANAYDAVNGNRNNLSKLLEAQGGVPTPEEEKLIVDIIDEIRQIDDVTPEEEKPVTNADTSVDEDDLGFPGGLIENVPVDFDNPDYHDMDLSPYISTILEPDELGYTDNPKYIAIMVKSSSDLIQQMKSGIIDGTGAALVRFNDDSTSEVPVEAIRDALQYQGINTNDILFKLRDEEVQSKPEPISSVEEPPSQPTPEYPGPRQPGYTTANTTIDIDGKILAAGMRVVATKDGRQGKILAIQNDPEYVRVLFDDGKTVVRSAFKIRALSNADGSAPAVVSNVLRSVEPAPSTDVSERLDRPAEVAPRIARSGETVGVNDVDSKIPDELKDLTQKDVPQTKFVEWGARDAEIAKAANNRVKLDEFEKAIREVAAARESRDRERLKVAQERLSLMAADIYGSREGLSFGAEYYTLKLSAAQAYGFGTPEEILSGAKSVSIEVSFDVLDQSGTTVGVVRRKLDFNIVNNVDGTRTSVVTASNSYMKVTGKSKKKGFASAYNRYMENWYIANGILKVNVFAAGGPEYQGGFVWALNGFGWSSDRSSEIKDILNRISRNAKNVEEKAIANRLLAKLSDSYNKDTGRYDLSKAPTPMELALVGWYPRATNWVGKSVMTQSSWNGVKNLVPYSREQIQARNYNQIKNAERRIQAGQNKPNVSSELVAYIASNDFQTDNPKLSAYIDQIRNVIRNNDPLGKLSPDAKTALSNYTSLEMINKDSKIKVEDTFKLRNALTAEYRADHAYSDPFQVKNTLTEFTADDFENDPAKIENAGYTYRELAVDESGMNSTWEVTHTDSGQVFYVKKEELSRNWNNVRGITGELEMSVLMNAMGMNGTYEVRESSKDEDLIIMSRAGANLPIATEPINASRMLRNGLTSPDGEKYYGDEPKKFIKQLKNPEDIIRMSILDMLGDNKDRHDGNWMVAYDTTDNKLVMFPVDNSLAAITTDDSVAEDQIYSFLAQEWREDVGNVYQNNMPGLVTLAGKDRAYAIYVNEVQKIIDNVDNELVKPKGGELAAIIDKWGTYDAFSTALKNRLKDLITSGTMLNSELKSALTPGYWR